MKSTYCVQVAVNVGYLAFIAILGDLILLVHSLQPYEELRDLTEVRSKKSATLELEAGTVTIATHP